MFGFCFGKSDLIRHYCFIKRFIFYQNIHISKNTLNNEEQNVIEDLIKAAHNNAKVQLKTKTAEEISKVTG